jgi:uncharacterized membrane protein YcaP (DUF421 family)
MGGWPLIDWAAVFLPETPVLETFVRTSVLYLGLFGLLRLILKRESGSIGITDLLFVVLLASSAESAMLGESNSIGDALLVVLTLVVWTYFLNWLGYRFPKLQRLVRPAPLLLVKDGEMLRRNMRKEFITEDELMSVLRQQGVEGVSEVSKAYMEGDGNISVITRNGDRTQPRDNKAI